MYKRNILLGHDEPNARSVGDVRPEHQRETSTQRNVSNSERFACVTTARVEEICSHYRYKRYDTHHWSRVEAFRRECVDDTLL